MTTQQVKTKKDFQDKMKAMKGAQKNRDPKYRLRPNLSIRGIDLKRKIENRSIILDSSGNQYNQDEDIENARRLSKPEIIEKARKNAQTISETKSKLEKNG